MRAGADWIKFCATGGISSRSGPPLRDSGLLRDRGRLALVMKDGAVYQHRLPVAPAPPVAAAA